LPGSSLKIAQKKGGGKKVWWQPPIRPMFKRFGGSYRDLYQSKGNRGKSRGPNIRRKAWDSREKRVVWKRKKKLNILARKAFTTNVSWVSLSRHQEKL